MKLENFYTETYIEATALRNTITQEEKNQLAIALEEHLNPQLFTECVYGYITGDCYSKRSQELLSICAKPLSYFSKVDFDEIDEVGLNDSFNFEKRPYAAEETDHIRSHYSAIELYIGLPKSKHEELINYIIGATDTFEPTI